MSDNKNRRKNIYKKNLFDPNRKSESIKDLYNRDNSQRLGYRDSPEKRKPHHNFKCKNCGEQGHTLRTCQEPITSWGVILVKIDGMDRIPIKHDPGTVIDGIRKLKLKDDERYEEIVDMTYHLIKQIKFLMISRKHSLGYVEFIMGRYQLSNIETVTFLIQQMLPEEIQKIKDHIDDFQYLWHDLWGKENSNPRYNKDYKKSLKSYERLCKGFETSVELSFLLDKIKSLPTHRTPEFGFPKGRKNFGETEKECALREFIEETGLSEKDIRLVDNVEPIVENIIGTNNVKYRHVYYLAESITNAHPKIGDSKYQKYEVGSVGYYSYHDAKHYIRSYHIEKINIITKLVFYYADKILNIKIKDKNEKSEKKSMKL